ncbi:MAG: YciI family protein [Pseudomonadota bacterium]
MPLYLINARDKVDSLDLRIATRTEHLNWVGNALDKVLMAGPVLAEDESTMAGSTFVIEAESLEAARRWAAEDPYKKAGLFDRVEIIPFKWTIGDGPKPNG